MRRLAFAALGLLLFSDAAAACGIIEGGAGVTQPSFFCLEVGRQFDVALPICAQAAAQS